MIEQDVIHESKQYINVGDLEGLQERWMDYQEIDFGRDLAWEYIFEKVYIHAALKKQRNICDWLKTLFYQLDSIQQIGIRHVFPYARYLMEK